MDTITYKKERHIITKQNEAEKAFLQEFSTGNYTLAQPLVKLNTYDYFLLGTL